MQGINPYAGTLFILDDGGSFSLNSSSGTHCLFFAWPDARWNLCRLLPTDIRDDSCRVTLDLGRCGQEFHCGLVNGTLAATGTFSQTSLPTTPNGVISFGCERSNERFTSCGSCSYDGPDGAPELAKRVRNSVVQIMYAR